ncbi:MAG: SdpI family protein [Myxococcota bacterium]
MDAGLLTIIGSSLFVMGLSVPLVLRKVPRNSFYGLRTPSALSSDRVWYPANVVAGRNMLAASAGAIVFALALRLSGLVEGDAEILISTFAFVVFVVAATIHAWLYADRLQDETEAEEDN